MGARAFAELEEALLVALEVAWQQAMEHCLAEVQNPVVGGPNPREGLHLEEDSEYSE